MKVSIKITESYRRNADWSIAVVFKLQVIDTHQKYNGCTVVQISQSLTMFISSSSEICHICVAYPFLVMGISAVIIQTAYYNVWRVAT